MTATCYSRKIKALLLVLAVLLLVRLLLTAAGDSSERTAVAEDNYSEAALVPNSDDSLQQATVAAAQTEPTKDKNTAFQNLLQTLASESASGGTFAEAGKDRETAAAISVSGVGQNKNAATTAEWFADYRLQRQMILEQKEKALREISGRVAADSELFIQVQSELLQLATTTAKEQTAENLIRAENGRETIVYYDSSLHTVTLLTGEANVSEEQAATLRELLTVVTGVETDHIKLIGS